MTKISSLLLLLSSLSTFHPASHAARTSPDAAVSADDANLEALAVCPECKRRFLRDHKLTDERYAELLEQRGKVPAPGDSKTETGQ